MPSDATELLTQVAAAYASCSTYRDDGVVTTSFFSPARRVQRKPFKTRFVRGQGFLFEFKMARGEDDWDAHTVWLEGERARVFNPLFRELEGMSGLKRQPADDTLKMALAGATGISGGSAWRIPSLLTPDLHERRTWLEGEAKVVEDAEAARSGLVAVEIGSDARLERVWIDPAASIIRRILKPRRPLEGIPLTAISEMREKHPESAADLERAARFAASRPPTEVESVTAYDAVFGAAIAADEMRFDAPTTE